MLNKKNRITSRALIAKLFQKGKTFKGKHLIFKFLPGKDPETRFAIVISKKISKKAVERNRFKRQISEALRPRLDDFKPPIVALVILKSADEMMNYANLETEVADLVNYIATHAE